MLLFWQHLLLVLFFHSLFATPHMTNTEEPGILDFNSPWILSSWNTWHDNLTTRADMRQARKRRKKGILHLPSCRESLMPKMSRGRSPGKQTARTPSRAGTGDVHLQAGKVSGVLNCDQSRSEQPFPSFLAWNWLLLCYLLFFTSSAGDHLMPHIPPSARVTL